MSTATRLEPERVREIAVRILTKALGSYGFADAKVSESEDTDGEPVIDISAIYAEPAREPDPRTSLKAELDIQRAIFREGDERTVHVLHILPTDDLSLPED